MDPTLVLACFCLLPAGGRLQGAQTPVHLETAAGMGDELSGRRGDGSEGQSHPATATPPQTPPSGGHPEETPRLHGKNRWSEPSQTHGDVQ